MPPLLLGCPPSVLAITPARLSFGTRPPPPQRLASAAPSLRLRYTRANDTTIIVITLPRNNINNELNIQPYNTLFYNN